MKREVLKQIKLGKENAITARLISKKIGTTQLVVRLLIRELREDGNLIIANSRGYYFGNDILEVKEYANNRLNELNRELELIKEWL